MLNSNLFNDKSWSAMDSLIEFDALNIPNEASHWAIDLTDWLMFDMFTIVSFIGIHWRLELALLYFKIES